MQMKKNPKLLEFGMLLWTLSVFSSGLASADFYEGKFRKAEKPISDRYIVVLKDNYASTFEEEEALVAHYGGIIIKHYDSRTLHGYLANLTERSAMEFSKRDNVAFVEQDSIMSISETQNNATWGLDRIDQ